MTPPLSLFPPLLLFLFQVIHLGFLHCCYDRFFLEVTYILLKLIPCYMICNKINIFYFELFQFWMVYRNAIHILILSLHFSLRSKIELKHQFKLQNPYTLRKLCVCVVYLAECLTSMYEVLIPSIAYSCGYRQCGNPSTWEVEAGNDQMFKLILGYTASLRPCLRLNNKVAL